MMTNAPRFSVQPPAGRQLPPDWQRNAKANGAAADSAYRSRIENAWKQGHANTDPNVMRQARLSASNPLQWSDLLGER
jgi:hypothetical protein